MEKRNEIKVEVGNKSGVKISKLEEDIKFVEATKKTEKIIVPNKGKTNA